MTTELPEDEIQRLADKAEEGYGSSQLRQRTTSFDDVAKEFGHSRESLEALPDEEVEFNYKVLWEDRAEDGSGYALAVNEDGPCFLVYAYGAVLQSEPMDRDKVFGLHNVLDGWLREQA